MTVLVFRVWRGWKKKLKRRRRPVWLLGAALGPVLLAVFASGASPAAAADVMPPAGAWIGALSSDAKAPGEAGVPSIAMSPVLAVEAFAPSGSRGESPSFVTGESAVPFPYDEPSLHGAFFQFPVEALESSSHAGPGSRLAGCAPVSFP